MGGVTNAERTYILAALPDPNGEPLDFRIVHANAAACERSGFAENALRDRLVSEVLPRAVLQSCMALARSVLRTGEPRTFEVDIDAPGPARRVHCRMLRLGNEIAVASRDVAPGQSASVAPEEPAGTLGALIDTMPLAVVSWRVDGRIDAANAEFCRLLGYTEAELRDAMRIGALHRPIEPERARPETRGHGLLPAGLDPHAIRPGDELRHETEGLLIRKDGSGLRTRLLTKPVFDDTSRLTAFISVAFDGNTEGPEGRHARYDSLTGLPERPVLERRTASAIEQARLANGQVVVLLLDLDNLKRVTDSLGHRMRDQVLVIIARRIQAAVRGCDLVARIGADEFAILLAPPKGAPDPNAVVRRLIDSVSEPIASQVGDFRVTPSIGIAIWPEHGPDIDALLRSASLAAHAAKRDGGGRALHYSARTQSPPVNDLKLESALREAMARDEFFLEYQPKVSLVSGQISGLEALLRWRHPEWGLISPLQFIGIAEATGLIVPLGAWVLETACRQAVELRRSLGTDVTMAVNLSPVQFRQPDLPRMIERAMEAAELPPGLLELEITETSLLAESMETSTTLGFLREIGVGIAVDDFGTGFSNLSMLDRFRVDRLKLDRSLLTGLPGRQRAAAIVKAVVSMAQWLGLDTTAEGVEDAEQVTFLRGLGCSEAQGFFFARPTPACELAAVIRSAAGRAAETVGYH